MPKKILSLILAFVLLLSFFTGCSEDKKSNTTDVEKSDTESKENKQTAEKSEESDLEELNRDAKLKVWSIITPEETEEMAEIVKEFTDETGIDVEVVEINQFELKDKFMTEAPTGTGPDVIMSVHSDTGTFVVTDMVRPLDFLFDQDIERFHELAIESFIYDDKIYGIGYSIESYGLVYNKDLVDKIPETWDELFELARELTRKEDSDNVEIYGFLVNPEDYYFTYPLYSGYGGYVFGRDDKGNFKADDIGIANEGSIKALEQLKSLVDEGIIPIDIQVDVINDFFTQGKLAMMIYGPWFFNQYKENGVDFGYVPLPKHADGTQSQPFATILGFMLSNHSKYPKEADALLQFLLEDGNQQRLIEAGAGQRATLNLSVYNSSYVQDNEYLKNITEINYTGQPLPNIPESPIIWEVIPNAIQLAIKGDLSVEEALKEAEEMMIESIEKMRE